MALTDQIQSDLTGAMKARDSKRTATLRMVLAAIKNQRVAAGQSGDLSDAQTLELLAREAKKRTEAATAFRDAGREELADKEEAELAILRTYLPAQLSEAELRTLVDEAIAETGAAEPGDLGRVMSAVMPKTKGRADGKQVNAIVRERLGG